MALIVLVVCGFVLFCFPICRCAVSHPVRFPLSVFTDIRVYFQRKEFNRCPTGELVAYTGLFGKGKTLSVVHRVVSAYNRYNDKPVWCPRRKKMVTQKVKIISNVSLCVPYEDFQTLEQIVYCADNNRSLDDAANTLTVTLVLGDEFSVQMNSRNFKTNIDPLFLNTILTCRHYYISLYYTAQRFGHVDALLRQVTSYVVDCNKLWRFQRLNKYDAWDLENATSTQMVKPYARSCWFVRDSDYAAYDTLACVGNLKKSMKAGDMISAEEIMNLQQPGTPNMEVVDSPSRKYLKRFRQRGKRK